MLKGAESYWIGLSDQHDERTFRWEGTGEEVGFSYWRKHQPDNHGGTEDCTHYYNIDRYKWNDMSCDYQSQYICQRMYKEFSSNERV
ncbi:hypothetical protein KUTeg_002641 [Tegillarca granosa]|uniref:C-type lectin domain-containing protein n=1 Tax=Tegillarca granosa TaxID=220873 RepID=A0ABQ9FUX5_TEGGR|nr:hypothetical protein KUTeg_002641 [Tegillarca granosa]